MRGYVGIDRALSACVHFVRNREIRDPLTGVAEVLSKRAVRCAYVDCSQLELGAPRLINSIAERLQLIHAPYLLPQLPARISPYVPFLDDLIALSHFQNGVLIVVDRADELLRRSQDEMFDLIEAFLIQVDDWLEKGKPCHLCFQMEPNEAIRRTFEPLQSSR